MVDMRRYKPVFIALEVVYALAALGIVGTMIRERQQDDPIWYGVLVLVTIALAMEVWLNFRSTDSRTRHIVSITLAAFCVAELIVTLLLRNAGVITLEGNYPVAMSFYFAGIVSLIVLKTVGLRKRNSREYYGKKFIRMREMQAAQAALEAAEAVAARDDAAE